MSEPAQRNPAGQPIDYSSPLLSKARSFGLDIPEDLERLAIQRGCDYYARDFRADSKPISGIELSNSEIAIALIANGSRPKARQIRLAAAMLGAQDVNAEEIVRMAEQENCAHVLRYIATCGRKFEPENPFWSKLLRLLPDMQFDRDALPHPTRFVEMTGIDRQKIGTQVRWIRPRLLVPA